jgi:hypothetical protein
MSSLHMIRKDLLKVLNNFLLLKLQLNTLARCELSLFWSEDQHNNTSAKEYKPQNTCPPLIWEPSMKNKVAVSYFSEIVELK